MGRKVFVTYKYGDINVPSLDWVEGPTKVRDYVTELQYYLKEEDNINKGELDGQDLSDFKDESIESHLRDKIYDSTVTLVMISSNMKEFYTAEKDQWIPWEIAYSLKDKSRSGRKSPGNAILALTLPDRMGSYDYYIKENICNSCNVRYLETNRLFQILRDNMFNVKKPVFSECQNHKSNTIYKGYSSFIHTVKWSDFIVDVDKHLDIAINIRENMDDYEIVKTIK